MDNETKERPTLYMLVGLPCTGKSTILRAKLNKEHQDAVVLSTDDYIEKLAEQLQLTYNEVFADHVGGANRLMDEAFRNAIKEDKTIVWDQTNLTRKIRKGKLKAVPAHYVKICYVCMEADPILLQNRMKRFRPNKVLPIQVLESMSAKFEEPTLEEGFDKIFVVEKGQTL